MTSVHSLFQTTLDKTAMWIREVMSELNIADERKALRALRAGLHTIRDRLPAAEVVDLGAQLPLLLRGLYYEGWSPSDRPEHVRRDDELLRIVRDHLDNDPSLDAEDVLRAVIHTLAWHISRGELDDIASTLPRPLARLWGESFA